MWRRRPRTSRVSSRGLIVAFVAFAVLAVGGIVAFDLLRSGGGGGPAPRPPVAVQTVPPSERAASGPDLRFDANGVDFGVVPLNTEVGYAFTYTNAGSQTLRIQDVRVRVVQGC